MAGTGTMAEISLRHAESEAETRACFPAMRELRPRLGTAVEFLDWVARQRRHGYRLLAAWRGDDAVAVAGYREQENLVYGRFVYVDDLVTSEAERRQQLGKRLLDAVAIEARRLGCGWLVLDTALANALAQRFYFRQGMLASALRFRLALDQSLEVP
jgi:ribosomal protein S18 acetylase RimI-like enzyme